MVTWLLAGRDGYVRPDSGPVHFLFFHFVSFAHELPLGLSFRLHIPLPVLCAKSDFLMVFLRFHPLQFLLFFFSTILFFLCWLSDNHTARHTRQYVLACFACLPMTGFFALLSFLYEEQGVVSKTFLSFLVSHLVQHTVLPSIPLSPCVLSLFAHFADQQSLLFENLGPHCI